MDAVDFNVETDETSLSRSARGQVSGVLYVTLGQTVFPESRWSDLIVAVLGSWLDQTLQLLNHRTVSTHLRFMDGPFQIGLALADGPMLSLELVRTDRLEVLQAGNVTVARFSKALADAVDRTLSVCAENTWWSPDIDRLVRMRPQLDDVAP